IAKILQGRQPIVSVLLDLIRNPDQRHVSVPAMIHRKRKNLIRVAPAQINVLINPLQEEILLRIVRKENQITHRLNEKLALEKNRMTSVIKNLFHLVMETNVREKPVARPEADTKKMIRALHAFQRKKIAMNVAASETAGTIQTMTKKDSQSVMETVPFRESEVLLTKTKSAHLKVVKETPEDSRIAVLPVTHQKVL